MKRSPHPRRAPSNLSASLQQRLSAYTLAAGAAAGVSLLALAKPSEAQIVYTPADETIGRNGTYNLDLNHDGIIDFTIFERASTGLSPDLSSRQSFAVRALSDNRVKCVYESCLSTFVYAVALRKSAEIGPGQTQHGWLLGFAAMALEERFNGRPSYFESWANVKDRYLGLRFQINGETHYGWARLTVKFKATAKQPTWEGHLSGYAYESIPGKSIQAGQTTEDPDDATMRPLPELPAPGSLVHKPASSPAQVAPLGALALGADGIPLWRRDVSATRAKSENN